MKHSASHGGDARRAVTVSSLCIASYLVSYILRNLLAVYNPQMIAGGEFTEAMTAALSSVYMITYAIGQLVMGTVGDYVHPRSMVSIGLLAAGGAMLAFSVAPVGWLTYLLYGLLGLSLSMLRGPIVRLITGSCRLSHARLANLFLSFAGFVGPLLAGLFVLWIPYRGTYATVGALAIGMAALFFLGESILERRGYIHLPATPREGGATASYRTLLREDKLWAYLLLAMTVEITTSSVHHWLTLYMTEVLSMTEGAAAMLYSVLSFVRAVSTFAVLPLFYLLRRREDRLLALAFGVAGLLFFVMYLSPVRALSVVCMLLAEICTSVASAAVWSVYLPSLAERGRVSGINGLMDAAGYFVAALASLAFVPVAAAFSYGGLLLTWCAVCAVSVPIALCGYRRHAHASEPSTENKTAENVNLSK